MPLMPFSDVDGSCGAEAFTQNGPIGSNTGIIVLVTTILKVVLVAHWPGYGVNVYVLVPATLVSITAGLHVPVMLLLEMTGNEGAAELMQSGPIWLNDGVMTGLTIIVREAVLVQRPASGINV